jgi:hypothetical protein
MADISLILAIAFGILTAVPGLLPAAGLALVTWSRVISGVGWLGYGGGVVLSGGQVPHEALPGILLAQAGYGLAVMAIALQACRDR